MKICEENFIQYLRKKDERALEYLVETYGGFIKSIVKKHLYRLEQCQGECINDILTAVWYHIDSFREERSSFCNWLAGVSRYKCIDYKRKYLRLLENRSIEDVDVESSADIEAEVMKKDLDQDVSDLVKALKPQDRELFLKHYVDEMDIKDLSCETGLKPAVIYNRLSRGRNRLRAIFGNKL